MSLTKSVPILSCGGTRELLHAAAAGRRLGGAGGDEDEQRCRAAATGQWWCRRRPKRGRGNINFKPHALIRSGPLANY